MTKMTSSTSHASLSSHGKGISSRRRIAVLLSVLNMLLSVTIAGPVFSKHFQVSHHIQAGRNIRHLPCKIKRSGEEGVCMFAIDCLKSNGTHLGTCIDRFYFGSCCQIKDDRDEILNLDQGNSIEGILGILPNSNNNYNVSYSRPSSSGSSNDRVTTSRTPAQEVTTVFLTDEVTRKTTTTKRPFVPVSTISSSSSSFSTSSSTSYKPSSTSSTGSSHRPTPTMTTTANSHKTTTAATSTTYYDKISVSSGVLLNDHRPSGSTSVFATLSTKLPSIAVTTTTNAQKNNDKTTGSSSTSSNKPTSTASVPLHSTASTGKPSSSSSSPPPAAPMQTNKNQEDFTTTSPVEMEFTTFQSVNSQSAAPTSRRPISVITKRPTKFPFVTSTTPKLPPRRTPATKLPLLQDSIFPQREPPVLQNQIKSNSTTGRPTTTTTATRRPLPTTTRRPVQEETTDFIQISISPPKATTRKPSPNKTVNTKKPQVTGAPSKKPTKPIVVQKVPMTIPTTTTTTTTTTQRTTTTAFSPDEEDFTTISWVDSTRAPRPKPTPTAKIEQVSSTGWEEDGMITVEEGDKELLDATTVSIPLIKEDGTDIKTSTDGADTSSGDGGGSGGGERRTTTQKPVKITTSVKVETTTSSTTTTESSTITSTSSPVTPTSTTTTTTPPTTTTTERETTSSSTTSSSVPPVSSTTFATTSSTVVSPPPTTITTPELPITTSSSSSSSATQPSTVKPLLGEDTSENEKVESTTLADGIVTWTNIDIIEHNVEKNVTTEDPLTSQWVPLLTISSDDFKNTSTPISANDRTTTPMTPTDDVPEGNATVTVTEGTTLAPPTDLSESGDGTTIATDDKDDQPEITTNAFSNETTTLSPADEISANASTTARPSFPSLEGIDYRMICGKRMFPEPRIVGGAMASFGRWPWQISLRQWRTSTYLHKCGAALLNENWAITAAHCVDNVPPSDLLLRLGEFDLAEEDEPYGYQERRVQIVASHPQFDPRTFEYDLALLRFYEPVVFQPNIIPICVPETDENFIGRTAFVTGWGRLYEDGPLPSKLQEVSVPVIENKICETMYRSAGYIEHIPHIFICAGWKKGGYDSCEGDSGGPMVIQRDDKRFQLAGVISWGIGCAEPDQPGVYTRISEFRDWINQILQF